MTGWGIAGGSVWPAISLRQFPSSRRNEIRDLARADFEDGDVYDVDLVDYR
ncbi:MAG: hypothetical protein OXM58_09315 [Rhodospirillaceae bacterium]|nr:hypothetical protein [Rhodospirillaceae bacterium]MDE0616897.1 hypothetical protein [Rhodospirillaceae bacterium]